MTDLDLLSVGAGVGMLAGTYLGYTIRKIVERMRSGESRPAYLASKPMPSVGEAMRLDQDARKVMRDKPVLVPIPMGTHHQRIPVVKSEAPAPTAPVDQDREDVVAALVSLGYKKKDATAATDACSQTARDAGVEEWTKAALSRLKANNR